MNYLEELKLSDEELFKKYGNGIWDARSIRWKFLFEQDKLDFGEEIAKEKLMERMKLELMK